MRSSTRVLGGLCRRRRVARGRWVQPLPGAHGAPLPPLDVPAPPPRIVEAADAEPPQPWHARRRPSEQPRRRARRPHAARRDARSPNRRRSNRRRAPSRRDPPPAEAPKPAPRCRRRRRNVRRSSSRRSATSWPRPIDEPQPRRLQGASIDASSSTTRRKRFISAGGGGDARRRTSCSREHSPTKPRTSRLSSPAARHAPTQEVRYPARRSTADRPAFAVDSHEHPWHFACCLRGTSFLSQPAEEHDPTVNPACAPREAER